MKTKSLILAAIALFFAVSASVAQSLTTNAKAEIVAPVTITDASGLAGGTTIDFGVLTISPTTPGTCVLSTSNVRTSNGGVTVVNSSTSTTASFGVSGKAGLTYSVTVPAADVTVTKSGSTETMTINTFKVLPASSVSGDQLTGTIGAGGTDTFTVGGTLNIGAAQAEGVYESTFSISIAYN